MRSRSHPGIVRGFWAPAPSTVPSPRGDRPFSVLSSYFWDSSYRAFLGFPASPKKKGKKKNLFALPNPFAVSPSGGAAAGKPKAAQETSRLSPCATVAQGRPWPPHPSPRSLAASAGQPQPGGGWGGAKHLVFHSSPSKSSLECPQEETQVHGRE